MKTRIEPRLTMPARGAPREKRSEFLGIGYTGGPAVLGVQDGWPSARFVENLTTVSACVQAIAGTLASLPACVYRRLPNGGRVEAPNHPVARLIQQPNPFQTWADLLESLLASVLLRGNGLAELTLDGRGQVVGLTFIPWAYVTVLRVPSGAIAYDITGHVGPWGDNQPPRRLLMHQVLHLRDRSDDGFIGRSRLSRMPGLVRQATAEQDYVEATYRNGLRPSGALQTEQGIGDDSFERLKEQIEEEKAGVANGGKFLILDRGMTFKPFAVSPADAQVLESRKFSVEELARVYNVPPSIIGSSAANVSYQNAGTAFLMFAQGCLSPWAAKIEQEFTRSVLGVGTGYELTIDLSGLTRGDYATRWTAEIAAVQAGILDANEVRISEGWNARGPQAPAPSA